MVSVREATLRKTIGFALFGLTTLRVYAKGIAGISGVAFSFLYATAMIVTITGFANQCGCSLRLRWGIDEGRPFKDRSFTPPEHMKFIKGKRKGVLLNFAFSNIFAISLGVLLYSWAGVMSQQRLNSLLLGSALEVAIMVYLSLTNK